MQKGIDFVGVAVTYFCHDGKGNFVLDKRGPNSRDEQGLWELGGGGLEVKDSVEETLRKEIKEEYGCDVISFEFLGFRDVFRSINDIQTHWVTLDFKVLVDPKQVKNGEPNKLEDVRFFTFENIPDKDQCHSQLWHFLNKYRQKLETNS